MTVVLLISWSIAGLVWAANPTERTFDIKVTHGRVAKDMQVIRITQGDRLRLRLTTDEPIALHLHGYDIEKQIKRGAVTEFAFEAHAAGRFPVTVHGARLSHETTLLYVEVHPR